ncbi:hypothetical protein BDV39DRAFT_182319 [Aspergillus sergii]|uniref:Uncharacterized protein n=1 Tax=Aspergillus sergii TaxID=1034303 RepID=A0A5N6WR42_9EURO|nr:hypothetical protein BDV39DRAFT_182319 [Aspergillus sergii]
MSGQVHFPRPRADLLAIVMDLNDLEHLSSLVPYFLGAAVLIGILDAYRVIQYTTDSNITLGCWCG